jgi:hypothetical protein
LLTFAFLEGFLPSFLCSSPKSKKSAKYPQREVEGGRREGPETRKMRRILGSRGKTYINVKEALHGSMLGKKNAFSTGVNKLLHQKSGRVVTFVQNAVGPGGNSL